MTLGEDGITEDDILVHDQTNRTLASLLLEMQPPEFPVALGVVYCDPAPSYETVVFGSEEPRLNGGLNEILRSGRTWTVSD